MLLTTATPTRVKRGYYAYQASIGTGTVAVTVSLNGLTGVPLSALALSASAFGYVALPECDITATLTGDAKFALEPVAIDAR